MSVKNRVDSARILFIVIALIAIGTSIFLFLQVRTDKVQEALKNGGTLPVVLGVYDKDSLVMAEIFYFHPGTKKTAVLDIPVETGDLLKTLGRMDAVGTLFKKEDPQPFLDHLSALTGFPVSLGFFLSSKDLEKTVDLLSGIDIFISNAVENTATDPYILLPSGSNLLDGAKVKDYLLYSEEDENSTDRSGRYQKVFQSLLRKISDQKDYLLNPEVFPTFISLFGQGWDDKALRTFLKETSGADIEGMTFQRTLGSERVVDGKKLLFPHYSNNLLKETVKQTLDTLKNTNPNAAAVLNATIEIQNGTSRSGLASRAAQVFKSFGYEVSETKNATDTNVEKTVIIDRRNNRPKAEKAAGIIKALNIISQKEYFQDGSVDITIILGKDFDGRYVRN